MSTLGTRNAAQRDRKPDQYTLASVLICCCCCFMSMVLYYSIYKQQGNFGKGVMLGALIG